MARSRTFKGPDGIMWGVEVRLPGASNALIVFHSPDPWTERKNRYVNYDWHGPEASDVRGHASREEILKALDDVTLALLFRRSMPIGGESPTPALEPA